MTRGLIPPEIIEEVKDRTDIVNLIESYLPLQKKGRNYWGLCPFHLEDTPSFSVSGDKQIYYCFGCHKGGSAIHFVMEYENLNFPDALRKLAERAGITLPEREMTPKEKQYYDERKKLFAINEAAVVYYKNALAKHPHCQNYLVNRGISQEMMERFSLGFATESWEGLKIELKKQGFTEPDLIKAGVASKSESGKIFDRFRNRLMFPIFDVKGNPIAFVGRIIDDSSQAKYINTEGTVLYHKGRTLYALNLAHNAMRDTGEAVLMEGNLDVVSAHQFGVINAVAPQGTALTEDQAKSLKRYCSKVILAYDSDNAGKKATLKNMDILTAVGLRVSVMEMPEGLDPDDVFHKRGIQGWNGLKENSLTHMEYKIKMALAAHDISKAEGKAEAVKELGPAIFALKDNIERNEYIRRIAQALDIDENLLHMDVQRKAAEHRRDLGSNIDFSPPPREKSLMVAEEYIVRVVMENKKVFDEISAEEGWDFIEQPLHRKIIALIQENYQDYTWRLRDLSDFAEEDLGQEILAMALTDSTLDWKEDPLMLGDSRKRIRKDFLKKELNHLTNALKSHSQEGTLEEERRLLEKFDKIQKEFRKL